MIAEGDGEVSVNEISAPTVYEIVDAFNVNLSCGFIVVIAFETRL